MPDIPEVSNNLTLVILIVMMLLRERLAGTASALNGASWANVQAQLGEMRARLDALEDKEIPPPLFKEQVDRLEHRVDILIEKCDTIRGCALHAQGQRPDIHTD